MAQAGSAQEIVWVKSAVPSAGPLVWEYPEKAAQTFVAGDPVVLDTAGRVGIAVDTAGFVGIAIEAATGTTDTLLTVLVSGVTDIYRASQSTAGALQASAQTQVGLRCSYIKSTIAGNTTKTVLDTADVGNLNFEILHLRDAAATENGEVYFRAVPAKLIARG